MIKFENVNKLVGETFQNGRFHIYRVEDSLIKTYFHIKDTQTPFAQTIELNKEANPVYTMKNTFNNCVVYLDLETVKDKYKFLHKIDTLIEASITWE